MPRYCFTSLSESDTESLGERLGKALPQGTVVLLKGDIGAGKTCFTRGLAKGLGIDPEDVASPTFTLVHEHGNGRKLYHMDLYRLSGPEEAEESGLMEYFTGDAVAAVEWPDPIEKALMEEAGLPGGGSRQAVTVRISQGDLEDIRTIEIEVPEGSGIMAEER